MSENTFFSADVVVEQEPEVIFNPDVVINGRSFFYSPAQQLAKYICQKDYEGFRLSYENGFTSATVYFEQVVKEGTYFSAPKFGEKKCIGVLYYDLDKNRITLKKTNVNLEQHEFHADAKRGMDDCFGVQYEIFKYLRDPDLIQICTVERQVRHKQQFTYTITKSKAAKNGRFLQFKGCGIQFFIPKADFHKIEGKVLKEKEPKTKKKKEAKNDK